MIVALLFSVLSANPYLDEGRKHFADLEFDAAARSLSIAIEQPALTTAERREGFDLWAQALLATNHRDDAVQVYARLLKEDPFAPSPVASPKVLECFLSGKQRAWPKPSVTLSRTNDEPVSDEQPVSVELFDPWGLVKRIRWLEGNAGGMNERPAPRLLDHTFSVTPSRGSQRLLFDALDPADTLLAHLEVPLRVIRVVPAEVTASSGTPRWVTVTLIVAAVVSAGLAATFFGLAFQPAPSLPTAREVNAWNAGTTRDAALAWSFVGLSVGSGTVAVLMSAR